MIAADLRDSPEWAELARLIHKLDLMPHGVTQSFDPTPRDTSRHPGGARPAGGPNDDGNRRASGHETPDQVMLRSAEHFRRRARGCKTVADVRVVLTDAKVCVTSWTKSPAPSNPEWGSYNWKRQIVADVRAGEKTLDKIRSDYGISARTLRRYLAMFD